ncbi:hypothetical protein D6817_03625, partial [Candidatus Pacearchaeota archaeon]
EHINAQTLILNSSQPFTKQIIADDIESGSSESGDFSFTVKDLSGNLDVKIDNFGVLNITPQSSDIGLHEIELCVTDTGVEGIENKIGFCGKGDLRETSCSKFQVVVVENNTPPTIISSNSTNLTKRIFSTDTLNFEIFKFDPEGLLPDTYWYVDSQLKKVDSGSSEDKFSYSFGCNSWGKHSIRAVISDGLLNDSVQWNVDITKVNCAEGILPGEVIDRENCTEEWACYDWELCQNTAQSKEIGVLSNDDYAKILEQCNLQGLDEETCGFQIRNCFDISQCNSLNNKPLEIRECKFSLEPSCSDGIKNCHDGECEFLVDCGGPCEACATCSDNIKNQGEEGVDCGGPCVKQCPVKVLT